MSEVVGFCQYDMFPEWNLQLFEFCVRCCEQWAVRMKLKTEWAGRRLPDFACTTWFREGNRMSEYWSFSRGAWPGGHGQRTRDLVVALVEEIFQIKLI